MNSTILDEMNFYIVSEEIPIDSITIIKNGYLVYEEYYKDYMINPDKNFTTTWVLHDNTQKHYIWSCTKSITSLLIGIAIDHGFIDNTSQTFFEFFPERWNSSWDTRKLNITIEHLLRMESGLLGDYAGIPYETYGYDYLQHLLSTPLLQNPGDPYEVTYDSYSNAGTTLLSAIINRTTGRYTWDFAQEYLFDPIGIPKENMHWGNSSHYEPYNLTINFGSSSIALYPQDMAKIGYLCLNNGTWNGTQIVSSDWIERSQTDNPGAVTYGYLWWLSWGVSPSYYYASGSYGQRIVVVNDIDMVIVITAHESKLQHELINDYIIASAIT
jgi:CubicO group peptidase (beta-lactamase class C family)